jgi:two-component system response regulator HydG
MEKQDNLLVDNSRLDLNQETAPANAGVKILVVDDEQSHLDSLTRIFEREGYLVLGANSAEQALELLRRERVSVVLTDLVMPGMDGRQLLRACRAISPQTEIILMTAYGTIETAVEAIKEGAYDFITKPLKKALVIRVVKRALEKHSLVQENQRLRDQLESIRPLDIVGQSPVMLSVMHTVRQAASSSATVLLTGESGTGKELLARCLHRLSPRSGGPFVVLNCAALPATIIESELFGAEKGAYTGADHRRAGRIEAAHGGTLFLDEVGELEPAMQVKFLRVLQEGEFERLGSNQTLRADFRLIAATNQNLEEKVRSGSFRSDLYYRLNVIRIEVPPLRLRHGDIPLLASFFVQRYSKKNSRGVRGITRRALDVLCAYPWPGNVRELENIIERAVVLSSDDMIDIDDLPAEIGTGIEEKNPPGGGRGVWLPVGTTLEEAERRLLLATLQATSGDKNLAANMLGVATRTIYRKLEELERSQLLQAEESVKE